MATKKEVNKVENETTMAEVKKTNIKEENIKPTVETTTEPKPDTNKEAVEVVKEKEEPKSVVEPVNESKSEPDKQVEEKEEIKKPTKRPVTKYWGGICDGWL